VGQVQASDRDPQSKHRPKSRNSGQPYIIYATHPRTAGGQAILRDNTEMVWHRGIRPKWGVRAHPFHAGVIWRGRCGHSRLSFGATRTAFRSIIRYPPSISREGGVMPAPPSPTSRRDHYLLAAHLHVPRRREHARRRRHAGALRQPPAGRGECRRDAAATARGPRPGARRPLRRAGGAGYL
jgi:hypothetical protein